MNSNIKNIINSYFYPILVKTGQFFQTSGNALYYDKGHKYLDFYTNTIYDIIKRTKTPLPVCISGKMNKSIFLAKLYNSNDIKNAYFLLRNGKLIHKHKTIHKFGTLPDTFIIKNQKIYFLIRDKMYVIENKKPVLIKTDLNIYSYWSNSSLNDYFVICIENHLSVVDENYKVYYETNKTIYPFYNNYFCSDEEVYCLR